MKELWENSSHPSHLPSFHNFYLFTNTGSSFFSCLEMYSSMTDIDHGFKLRKYSIENMWNIDTSTEQQERGGGVSGEKTLLQAYT